MFRSLFSLVFSPSSLAVLPVRSFETSSIPSMPEKRHGSTQRTACTMMRTKRSTTSIERRLLYWTKNSAARLIVCALILGLGPSGSHALASEVDEVFYLERGDQAPFSGDLFPVRLSLSLGLQLERCEQQHEAVVSRLTKLHTNDLALEKEKARIKTEAANQRIAVLTRNMDEAKAFYRQPWFVASVSVFLTVAAVMSTVYVYDAIAGSLR